MEKKTIDWPAVEREYRAGLRSLKAIGEQYGVSDAGIIKRAKRDGWTRTITRGVRAVPAQVLERNEVGRAGFLYVIFVEAGEQRFYKIGIASHVASRISEHQCSSPFLIFISCCYFVPNMRQEERLLHERFSAKRVRGEWFELSDDDLVEISSRSLLCRD